MQSEKRSGTRPVNGSVLDIGNSFPFRPSPKIQQMVDVTRRAHLQSFCYPFHRHRRLRSQPRCHGHLPRVSFGSASQLLPPPTDAVSFLPPQSLLRAPPSSLPAPPHNALLPF